MRAVRAGADDRRARPAEDAARRTPISWSRSAGWARRSAELEATLGSLADERAPVVALPGDLESRAELAEAVATLRAAGKLVVDGRLVPQIELPGATIARSPVRRRRAGWSPAPRAAVTPADVAALFARVTARPELRILVATEAPRGIVGGEPVGERALVPGRGAADRRGRARAGHPEPSPARTGQRTGAHVALTPGTSDATTRLPGPRTRRPPGS